MEVAVLRSHKLNTRADLEDREDCRLPRAKNQDEGILKMIDFFSPLDAWYCHVLSRVAWALAYVMKVAIGGRWPGRGRLIDHLQISTMKPILRCWTTSIHLEKASWSETNVTFWVAGEEIGTFFYNQCSRGTSPLIRQWISNRKVRTFTRKVCFGSKLHGKFWSHGLFIEDFPQCPGKRQGSKGAGSLAFTSPADQPVLLLSMSCCSQKRGEIWAWVIVK